MKTRILMAAFTCFGLVAAESTPNVELTGILVDGSGSFVVIRDGGEQRNSMFLREGQDWRGYRIVRIDSEREEVHIEWKGISFKKRIIGGSVKAAMNSGSISFKQVAGEVSEREGVLVYSADAVLQCGPYMISSPSARMMSKDGLVYGELKIVAEGGASIPAGSFSMKDGSVFISAKDPSRTTGPVNAGPKDTPKP